MAAKGTKANSKIDTYKQLFKEFDKNGDNYLSIQEFRDLLKQGGCHMSDAQVADTFVFFDGPQGDRRITFDEFTKGLDQILMFVAKVKELFHQLDADKSGFLDRNELKSLLAQSGKKFTEDDVTSILRDADKNNDNKISFDEFIDACC
ncbi:uncharacterized protein LOC143296891 [Babylonia areolata]|uniref:uncharacterized protein LOC143296891 n=1 Tax=Babylonia areolata TaxID=304850 RepID=UPI003FD611E1